MNSLYHIAILEGYLARHEELPRNVQDAIAFLKQQATPLTIIPVKKKRKISLEQLQKMREGAAKARAAKLAQEGWTPDRLKTLKEMKAAGKTYGEIAAALGDSFTIKSVANAVYRYGI